MDLPLDRLEATAILIIFRQHADGSGEAERLTTSEGNQATGSWSRDGKTHVFGERHPETGFDDWSLSMDGGEAPKRLLYEPFDENVPTGN